MQQAPSHKTPPLPSDVSLQKIAAKISRDDQITIQTKRYASVRSVLSLLGKGALLTSIILAPGTAKALSPLLKNAPDYDTWKHFNPSYLRRTIRRLEKLKQVEIVKKHGHEVVCLTRAGKRKILEYNINTIHITQPKRWDKRWRIVLYDIPTTNRITRNSMRKTLLRLGFYPMQESVYVYPYPCFDEIEYIRQYYFLDVSVQYILAESIENDEAYKTYFNLT